MVLPFDYYYAAGIELHRSAGNFSEAAQVEGQLMERETACSADNDQEAAEIDHSQSSICGIASHSGIQAHKAEVETRQQKSFKMGTCEVLTALKTPDRSEINRVSDRPLS